jgi:DNA-directed RNA polymerase specialized sigma24 family protein
MRLEGASNEEIAEQLGCTTRTVQRKLHLVERMWRQQTN